MILGGSIGMSVAERPRMSIRALITAAFLLAPAIAAADSVLVADAGIGLGIDDAATSGTSGPHLSGLGSLQLSGGAGWGSGPRAYLFRVRASFAPVPLPSNAVRAIAVGFSVRNEQVIPYVGIPIVIDAGAGLGMFDRAGRESLGGGLDVFGGLGIPVVADHSLVLDLRFSSTAVLSSNILADVIELGGEHHFATFILGLEWRS